MLGATSVTPRQTALLQVDRGSLEVLEHGDLALPADQLQEGRCSNLLGGQLRAQHPAHLGGEFSRWSTVGPPVAPLAS